MKITARGICKLHFWGTYSQSSYLHFDNAEDAALALPQLRRLTLVKGGINAAGNPVQPRGWLQDGATCGVFASGSDVERVDAQLVALGADASKISSLAHSCDRGEPFEVTLDVEDPNQTSLFP